MKSTLFIQIIYLCVQQNNFMLKNFTFLLILCLSLSAKAQINRSQSQTNIDNRFLDIENDTINPNSNEIEVQLSGKTHYTDYKKISINNDSTFVDTTLTIQKYYKFNALRKDNLELQQLANQGQTFNTLAYSFDNNTLYPKIGARAKHFNYFEPEDIDYYYVPTPTTELMYRTGLEQGQVLDGIFTFNTSPQFNASVAFRGLRSLGKYRNTLTDYGNMRVTLNYLTKNKRYSNHSHIAAQDLINNENGGLTDESIVAFVNNDPNFKDRNRMVTNFTDANNVLRGNRYFIDHYYKLWQKNDTIKNRPFDVRIGHNFNYEVKNYQYNQDAANTIFGSAFTTKIDDKLKYNKLFNEVYLGANAPDIFGEVRFKVSHFKYNYAYKSIVITNDQIINSNLNGNTLSVGGEWKTNFKKFNVKADASSIVSGDLTGYHISGAASYVKDSIFEVRAMAYSNSKSPNFNFILNQSDYKSYNWQNNFSNEKTTTLGIELDAKKWIYASAQITNITNYTYFDAPEDGGQTKPAQASQSVNYLKVKLSKEIKFGKFALDNQFIYQNVSSGSDVFRVPDFITRNTLYYSNYLFKGKPLFLQTGVTFKYFSKYYMNSYNPLISEFYLQNEQEFGGYPLFDFFVNAQIRTIRLYLNFEHFNADFGKHDYFAAPANPYRDFTIRFGLVWNFFI